MPIVKDSREPRRFGSPGPRHISASSGIFHRLCPRCREGQIFNESRVPWFSKMRETCAVCGLKFEREEGYFLGAMYISYAIALVAITLLSLLVWKFTQLSFERVVLCGVILFLPLVYPITMFSRVLWIYLDRTIDPEKP